MTIKVGYKVIVALSTIIILAIASSTYIVHQPAKKNPAPNTPKETIVPSYHGISIYNGEVELSTSELKLRNDSASMKVLTSKGSTIAAYKFNQNISDISYNAATTNSTKYFMAFLSYPNNVLNLKAMDALNSAPCNIKIRLNGENSPNSLVEIKTVPTSVVMYVTITLLDWDNNYTAIGQVETSNNITETYLNYNYSVLDLNNTVVSHAENIPELNGKQDKNIFLTNINKGLFNSNQIYIFTLEYNIGYVNGDGQNISYTGYIKNMPFIPEKLIQISDADMAWTKDIGAEG